MYPFGYQHKFQGDLKGSF